MKSAQTIESRPFQVAALSDMGEQMIKKLLAAVASGLLAGSVMAAPIVWDWSPAATGGTVTSDGWTNENPGQHFGERVSFASPTMISGIDIYLDPFFGASGWPVVITIWQDASGQPGAVAAQHFTLVNADDLSGASATNHRLHADFPGFLMQAGVDYWIGMAADVTQGASLTLTQTGLSGVAGGDSRMAQFNTDDTFSYFTGTHVGDMAFRLYGEAAPAPEPATLSLLGLGLAGLAAARRRKQ